jgi:hypothetical protein
MKKIIFPVLALLVLGGSVFAGYWYREQSVTSCPEPQCPEQQTTQQQEEDLVTNLIIGSDPDGISIFLNDRDTAKVTPYVFEDIDPGTFAVRLQSETVYPWRATVEVKEGETVDIKALLYEVVPIEEQCAEFITETTTPTVAPVLKLTATYPEQDASIAGLDGEGVPAIPQFDITLTFDQELDTNSLTTTFFSVINTTTNKNILTSVHGRTDPKQVILRVLPAAEIASGTTFKVVIKKGLRRADGQILAANIEWMFNTK